MGGRGGRVIICRGSCLIVNCSLRYLTGGGGKLMQNKTLEGIHPDRYCPVPLASILHIHMYIELRSAIIVSFMFSFVVYLVRKR